MVLLLFPHFNPRSLTGATGILYLTPSIVTFQSTLPYGSDFKVFKTWNGVITFQSTLPYGSDAFFLRLRCDCVAFQSTLPYGSDRGTCLA